MASNEETNAAGTDTRPPMLVESDYDSWKIRIHRYIRGKPNGKLIWKSIQDGPTPHPMITDPPPTDSTIVPAPRKKLESDSVKRKQLEWLILKLKSFFKSWFPRHIFNNLNQQATARRFRIIGDLIRISLEWNIKITQLNIPTHQMNTKFVNNLPAYWGKYVTNVKQNMDISTTPYVQIYTHLKAYEPHAKKTLKKQEQSYKYFAEWTHLMATMTQIANPKVVSKSSFHPPYQPPRTSPTQDACYGAYAGHIDTEPVSEEGSRKMDSQYFKDKALLMEAKEKGDVLDAEAEAFLADVDCTAPYDQPQHCPNAAVAFMANLSSTSATNSQVNEVHSNDNPIFDNVDYQLNQEMHQEEHLDSDAETEIDDNTIPYHQYLLDTEAQNVPTEVSADTSDKVSMIAILTDLQTQLDGHAKVNQEKCLEVETLKNELSQCKQEIYRLDTQKVKLDLEHKVRLEQALVIQRNKRNAELVQENDLLKSTLSGKEKSIAFLQSEKEKIFSEKKDLADSYLDEIVCLKNANKVARDILQRFNMPTETIPMLFKKPKMATADLHKDLLGTRNPGLGYMAKRAQPALYDADTLLHLTHQPVSIWDSEEVLVQQVVSMKKMSEKPGHVRPANGFYEKLNALMFVPQQELSREQAYWLPANERASQTSNQTSPVTPFVHKCRPPSQVLASLRNVNAAFPQFEGSKIDTIAFMSHPQLRSVDLLKVPKPTVLHLTDVMIVSSTVCLAYKSLFNEVMGYCKSSVESSEIRDIERIGSENISHRITNTEK
ncbi:hypothetical protein Tco_0852234 [Tanacetum coccineum]